MTGVNKLTKIVATVADNKCDLEFLQELIDNGVNVVRINTAHQTPETTVEIVDNVRKVSDKVPILLDTKGPEVRTMPVTAPIDLNEGDKIGLQGNPEGESTPECFCVNYAGFVNEVNPGDKILIDDGELELEVVAKEGDTLTCEAKNSGEIKGRKSVNVPGVTINLPSLSEKDKAYVQFAIEQDIEFIAHSFVRNKQDVLDIQELLDAKDSKVKIVAKIENEEGVRNIEEILEVAAGVMVARGDLGIEMPAEKIPSIQRKILKKCVEFRKPVIIATQMLHTMIKNPRPTRAEVTDVANAIYQGTDCIMLSGESAYGDYPIEAVATMTRIANEVEASKADLRKAPQVNLNGEISGFLTQQAVRAANKLNAKAILADSMSGNTVRNLAGYRGKKPIYALCYDKRIMRELALVHGVYPCYYGTETTDKVAHLDFLNDGMQKIMNEYEIQEDDLIVVVAGNYGRKHGASFIEISTAGNLVEKIKKQEK